MVSLICLSAVVKTCQLNVIMAGLELINNVQILKEKSFFLSEKKNQHLWHILCPPVHPSQQE